ncbi:MAG: T9SS type A sorting domain-containing protein, partial [Flavobacteriales bacterium]
MTLATFAQVIDTQNFTSLTTGNVGTNFTGATVGQGGYYLLNGVASDYQIATIDAAHGNSLKITAGSGFAATSDPNNHYAIKVVAVDPTAGNNIIKANCSFYTGSANGIGSIYFTLFDDATTPGVIASLIYNVATKTITAGGSLTTVATGARGFFGIKVLGTTYPANTWVNIGIAYNMTTGAYTWQTPQELYTLSAAPNANYTLVPGLDIGQYRTYNINASGNTAAYDWAVDDINVIYSNNIVLGTKETAASAKSISISPNPTTDILNIKTYSKINNVSVSDMTGRKVNVKLDVNKVDVSSLPAGNYLINVET